MRTHFGVLVAAGLMFSTPGAAAHNCTIPGIVNPAKKAVCANPLLAAANATELSLLEGLRTNLPADARRALVRDRRSYLTTRDRCGSDERCLEATMRAQVRLYRRVEPCAQAGARALFCTTRAIERHRYELHRSM